MSLGIAQRLGVLAVLVKGPATWIRTEQPPDTFSCGYRLCQSEIHARVLPTVDRFQGQFVTGALERVRRPSNRSGSVWNAIVRSL